ncbi:DUF2752 domain-containing protein [Streptomyces coffeae]|uniref:DUF2752 domain-containing protein n=1 Tax=Streptomyces coffeae TaxID=621382 RepID=UPI0027DD4306|nr:DUF2752 domain-containing protein [Streptomyces coffeae]
MSAPLPAAPDPAPSPAPPPPGGGAVRRLFAPLGVLAGVVAAFGYVGAVDPHQPGHYPVCPVLRLTGLYCPACGGLRGAHALAHGDLPAALRDNALAVLCYALLAVCWLVWCARSVAGGRFPLMRGRPFTPRGWQVRAFLGVVVIFTIVRNSPFGGLLTP